MRVPWTARRSNKSILKEIQRVFFGRNDGKAETPVLCTCHMGPEPWASPSRPHGLQEGALGSSRAPACTAHTQTVPDTPAPRPTRHWLGRSPCFSAILVLTWLPRRGGIASPLKASAARPGLQMSSCPGFYPPLGHMCIRWWDAAAEAPDKRTLLPQVTARTPWTGHPALGKNPWV